MPTPYQVRSLWLQQALDREASADLERLDGELSTDVAIVGGGFVGLWTAIHLKRADPAMDVAVVEADICGGGASGRNTGQILPLWSKLKTLEAMTARDEAVFLAQASEDVIDEIEDFVRERGADVGFRRSGWLWLASSPAQDSTWDGLFEACAQVGVEPFVRVSAAESRERSGSPIYRGGVFMPAAATVQPALLAREMRAAARDLGVRILEQSPVRRIVHGGDRAVLETSAGRLRADKVVLALGGWSRSVSELGKRIITVGSEIIATEPIRERLDEAGWTGYEPVTNARLTLRYTRRTDDDRVIFGRAGTSLGFAGRVAPAKFEQSPASARALAAELPRYVPAAAGARVTHAWIGPVDRSFDGLPVFGELASSRGRVLYATGFSGNGVGPAVIAAKALTSMVLGRRDEWAGCAFVDRSMKRWPPEPARYLGGEMVRLALTTKENREEQNRPVPLLCRWGAKLAPGGLGKDDTTPTAGAS